jgi:hypothetical protein
MRLKNASFLALIGSLMLTALLVANLIYAIENVMQGLAPAMTLFASIIHSFAAFAVAIFFFVFHRAQH